MQGQTDFAIQHFDKDRDGALNRVELSRLFETLQVLPRSIPDPLTLFLQSSLSNQYPFDTAVAQVPFTPAAL